MPKNIYFSLQLITLKMRRQEEEKISSSLFLFLISFVVVSTHWQRHGYENSCGVENEREKK